MVLNVYASIEDREKYLAKYYTADGRSALENRLKALIAEYMKNPAYPVVIRMFGFPALKIRTKESHQGMIDELQQILGIEKTEVVA